jgi:ubiquitin carboxyl-terminal hydrolase 25
VADFSDDLLIYSYRRQIACDPENSPFYLHYLAAIAEARDSEALNVEYLLAFSNGKPSVVELEEAYNCLGLSRYQQLDDNNIIGIFNARIQDAPKQEPQMRPALQLIAKDRGSDLLMRAATNNSQSLYPFFLFML